MPETACPLISLQTLRTHLETCPECLARQKSIAASAVEILLAHSSSSTADNGRSFVLVINQSPGVAPVAGPQSPTFAEFIHDSFEPSYLRNMRAGGRKNYCYLLKRHILPKLGGSRLSEITFDQIQRLVQGLLEAGYAVQSARHVRLVITCVFKHATRTGHFTGPLPCLGVRLPVLVRTRERRALTVEQASAVLKEFKSPYREMALVSMTTSMNLAEICGLKWRCVNLSSESIIWDGEAIPPHSLAVRESYYEGEFGPPKTASRRRFVPLPEVAVAALQLLKNVTRFSAPDHVVFATRNGTPKLASNLRHAIIKPVGKRLGMPWLNWHAFRYTFATIGEQLNISLADRQAGMGHGSVWMTQEYTVSNLERLRVGAEMIARKIA
jgi:integrase